MFNPNSWQVSNCLGAATDLCHRNSLNPHEVVMHGTLGQMPRYVHIALQMAELREMLDAMRNCGLV